MCKTKITFQQNRKAIDQFKVSRRKKERKKERKEGRREGRKKKERKKESNKQSKHLVLTFVDKLFLCLRLYVNTMACSKGQTY